MNKEQQIEELKKTIDKAQEQILELQKVKNDFTTEYLEPDNGQWIEAREGNYMFVDAEQLDKHFNRGDNISLPGSCRFTYNHYFPKAGEYNFNFVRRTKKC